jgi:hypothetical protein
VNQGQHAQILFPHPVRRIDQHSFDRGAVVRLPLVGLPLRLRALRKQQIEAADRLCLIGMAASAARKTCTGW